MKKKFMRMISILMVLVMTLGMCVTGYAANECSITVENSVGGVTYSLYKIFDATYSGDNVSYTFAASNTAMESLVNGNGSPFVATLSADGSVYVVTAKTDSETDVTEWLNSNASALASAAIDSSFESKSGTGSSIKWENLNAGYYLIVPSSNDETVKAVTVTTAAPDATVMDKNQTPGGGTFTKDADETSYSVGDTATYTVTSYVPTYDGDKKVVSYTFTDTMGAGLTYDENSISIIITGTGIGESGLDITNSCTVTADTSSAETVLTITYEIADISNYPADATVTITYSATVNEAADEEDLYNNVNMTWVTDDTSYTPDPGPTPGTHSYVYGFDLTKTDGTTTKLDGAQFTLQKQTSTDDDGNPVYGEAIEFVYNDDSNTYEESDGTDTTTDAIITVTNGEVNIWGLGEGTYILTEIVAPDGYNLLDAPVTIVIETVTGTDSEGNTIVTGWTVTVGNTTASGTIGESEDGHGVSNGMPVITIVNNAGSTLPGTGGIGTTIFYVVGTLLVLAAAALVVAKMRLGKTE